MNAVSEGVPTARHRAELRGRAAGAGILTVFGLAWTNCGISAGFPAGVTAAVLSMAMLIALGLVAGAVRLHRRAAFARTHWEENDAAHGPAVPLRFGIIVALEFVGIFILARILTATGHGQAIPAAIAIVVGVHFFPLARMFNLRLYHVTGAALCAVGLVTLLLASLTGSSALWTMLPGLGSALTLFATGALLLVQPQHG
jgi:hypothetical protein